MARKILLPLMAVLLPMAAAADTLYVTEFRGAPPESVYYQAVKAPAVAKQAISITGTSAQSAAFASTTGIIRVHTDIAALVEIGGTNPTATSTSMRMAAGQTEYFIVSPGAKVAVKTP